MAVPGNAPSVEDETAVRGFQSRAVLFVQGAMEAILLLMIVASPWFFGAAFPRDEFHLEVGIGLLLALWGARMLLEGQWTWKKCPVALSLAGLILLGILQVTPLPRSMLEWLSPATCRMYDQLLPSPAEEVPSEEGSTQLAPPGTTISFYPAATRSQIRRLLAVFLVFVVVRNNLVSPAILRRLCVVCVLNGSALALFALIQHFSSPRDTIYWCYNAHGQVFGPFICRNHFPFYINMCLGLGAGLLLSQPMARGRSSRGFFSPWASVLRLLNDPATLSIGLAQALMVSSVAVSLSRGGFLALVGGFGICLLIKFSLSPRTFRVGLGVMIAGVAVMLACWFGSDAIQERLASIWKSNALEDIRPVVWLRVLPLVAEYPIWGTGYVTFEHMEPGRRSSAADANAVFDEANKNHAHNDYLEILIEGGAVGLSLSLFAVGVIYWLGCRALRRHQGREAAGLALGALIALTTLVLHSFVDFGLHIPANALLITVLSAHLCGLGSRPNRATIPQDGPQYRLRLGGLAPFLGAAACLGLGWMLCSAGWRAVRIDQLKTAAAKLATGSIEAQQRRIGYLGQAAALEPDDAHLQLALGDAWASLYKEQTRRTNSDLTAAAAASPACWAPGVSVLATGSSWLAKEAGNQEMIKAFHEQRTRDLLWPALRSFIAARNACPLLPQPHLALAAYWNSLKSVDVRSVYKERVRLLAPTDPKIWYRCGLQELEAKEPELACASWRRSLEVSDVFLIEILEKAGSFLSPREIFERVLPDQPKILLGAAARLFPEKEAFEKRRPFLQRALDLLETSSSEKDLRTRALVYKSLGDYSRAQQSYQTLLTQYPEELSWHLEFVQFLRDQGKLEEARVQLHVILAQHPRNAAAREILNTVTLDMQRKVP